MSFTNLLFRCQIAKESASIFLFGTKEAVKRLRTMQNLAIDEFEIRLPNGKENKDCYYSCMIIGPNQYDSSQEICPVLIAVTKSSSVSDTKPLETLFVYLSMKLYLSNFTQVVVPCHFYQTHSEFLRKKFSRADF